MFFSLRFETWLRDVVWYLLVTSAYVSVY